MIRIGTSAYSWEAKTPVGVKVFKGGEVNVTLPESSIRWMVGIRKDITIVANLTDSNYVMAFFMTIDAIRRISPDAQIHAYIPYLPYARQDRVCNRGEALSIRMFANLLNAMNLSSVKLLDPHSDVAGAVINNCIIETQAMQVAEILNHKHLNINTDNLWLVAPDAGAVKKTEAIVKFIQPYNAVEQRVKGYLVAAKSRNLQTQEITETRFDSNVDSKNLLVVDDICDGGRTFIELGKVLRERNCGELSLYVTHGIFSYGVDELLKIYDRIYTTDSFHPDENSELRKYTDTIKTADGLSRFRWAQV